MQVDWSSTEFCYSPIIQSQSTSTGYDLSPAAESSADDMAHKGVLLVSLGMRYKAYNANLGRSFMVDPSKVNILVTLAFCNDMHQAFCRSKKLYTIFSSRCKRSS